jgi:predicted nucleotidyltransferase
MTSHIHSALDTFAGLVRSTYGDALVALVLFGSHARGDATEDSDIDVGVILKTVADRRAVRDRLAELTYDVLLATGEDIQAVAISQDQWEVPETFSNPSLIQAMKQDGINV